MCVRVCMWVCKYMLWVCKYMLWVCKYTLVWCEHMGVSVVVWLNVFVSVKVCVWCCDVGVCGWVHMSVCQWYAMGLSWGTPDSLCKGWTSPEKGWSLLCCNPVPSTVQAHRKWSTHMFWMDSCLPSNAGNRIWSVSISCGLGFFSGFVLLDKEREQESFVLFFF